MIDIHAPQNARTYSDRRADSGWGAAIRELVDPAGADVVDLGCGGGIYTAAWLGLGAASVIAVDSSRPILEETARRTARDSRVRTVLSDAADIGLPAASADVIFSRALIHHLADLRPVAREVARLIRPGGTIIIQDRTPEDVAVPADVALPDGTQHIRGHLFEAFPRLLDIDAARRPTDAQVTEAFLDARLPAPEPTRLWETRAHHATREDLLADIAARRGRSILHELDDAELNRLVDHLRGRIPDAPVVEADRWTLWSSTLPAAPASATAAPATDQPGRAR